MKHIQIDAKLGGNVYRYFSQNIHIQIILRRLQVSFNSQLSSQIYEQLYTKIYLDIYG